MKIPETAKRIKLDIGLSWAAPNSCIWLSDEPDTFVIGVEPNRFANDRIKSNGLYCQQTGQSVSYPNPHFDLIEVGIDDVESETTKPFYHMRNDVGVSSLYKPNSNLDDVLHELSDIKVIPLSSVLESIDWNRFEYIDILKIDTQGNDLNVIKSAGKFLDKIVYIYCEVNCETYYDNAPSADLYDEYLTSVGFHFVKNGSVINGQVVDKLYLNTKLEDKAIYVNPSVL